MQTFLDYPPMQRGASLNLDAVKAEMGRRMDQQLISHDNRSCQQSVLANSFHEKADPCQEFFLLFSQFLPFFPVQPSRLCRHPSSLGPERHRASQHCK
jgi:hypothetical protein